MVIFTFQNNLRSACDESCSGIQQHKIVMVLSLPFPKRLKALWGGLVGSKLLQNQYDCARGVSIACGGGHEPGLSHERSFCRSRGRRGSITSRSREAGPCKNKRKILERRRSRHFPRLRRRSHGTPTMTAGYYG